MRRASLTFGCLLAFGLVLAWPVGIARAQSLPIEPTTVAVTVLDPEGREHTHTYDLSNPKDRKHVIELIEARKVIRLVQQKPVNILALSAELGVWTLVVFGLLFWVLKKMAWGPMLEGLRKREETIHGALTDAQKARDEAKGVQSEVQRRLDHLGEEIRNLMEEARRKAEALAADLTAKARQEIQTDRDRLRREIELARDQALQELWGQTAQLATLVSAKTIRRQLTPEDHRRLVDEALVELRQAGSANGPAKSVV